jgi:outer membrane immunogenic protein
MKKLFLSATAIATVMSASAFAADLPSIKSAPVAAPAPMWTGFYAGLNSGYGWGLTPGTYTQSALFADEYASTRTSSPSGLGAANTGTAMINQSGFIGGGQVGYNYQLYNKYLMGLEADIQGAEIGGNGYYNGAGATKFLAGNQYENIAGSGQTQATLNWFGTVRGRFGYLVTPTTLVFATGGLSYGGASMRNYFSSQIDERSPTRLVYSQILTGNGRASDILVGYNIGGGAEWMFSPNWSLKSEVLYYNLGSMSFSGTGYSPNVDTGRKDIRSVVNQTTGNFAGIIARAGLNYHLNTDQLTSMSNSASIVESLSPFSSKFDVSQPSWPGFYAGLNSGYGWSGHGVQTTSQAADAYSLSYDTSEPIPGQRWNAQPLNALALANSGWSSVNQSGYLGGLQVGYNYKILNRAIVGIETDLQGSTMNGSGSYSGMGQTYFTRKTGGIQLRKVTYYASNGDLQAGMNWFGSLRGRLGYLITPSLLAYGTGGLSYGGVYAQTNFISSSNNIEVAPTALFGQINNAQMLSGKGQATNSLVGWTAGAGMEWMLLRNWSLKTEALYYDLGSMNLNGNGYTPDSNTEDTYQIVGTNSSIRYNGVIARMGVNYHFDFGKEQPVVAKY